IRLPKPKNKNLMVFGWGISRPHVGYMSCRRHSRWTRADWGTMPYGKQLRHAQRIEVYSAAYKLAWKQIPALQRRAQPHISLRIHASIRRQLKAGARDPTSMASEALKEVFVDGTY